MSNYPVTIKITKPCPLDLYASILEIVGSYQNIGHEIDMPNDEKDFVIVIKGEPKKRSGFEERLAQAFLEQKAAKEKLENSKK